LARVFNPMLIARITAANGAEIRLCDFASAGATGTRYWSWLPMTNSAPAPVVARQPRDSSTIAKGTLLFRWTRPPTNAAQFLQFNTDPSFSLPPTLELPVTGHESLVKIDSKFERTGWWHWRIVSSNQFGLTPGEFPFARFRIDPSLPVAEEELRSTRTLDAQGNIAASPALLSFNGTERKIFEVAEWPEENYSVTFRFRVRSFPTNRIAQLFSAWAGPLDDPLRVTIDNGKISARIESGGGFATTGVPIETGRWYDLSAIKDGSKLSLLIDGQERAHCTVPEFITSRANDFALGGNPHYTGNEFVDAEIEKMRFRSQ
ncbi:MAG TPA: laminin G domain-containing protein, partial [Candidatus Kapabacteria bacterium]|nr:laminin G domain-containing protein [Candidatus Kapabacteria bacterium]